MRLLAIVAALSLSLFIAGPAAAQQTNYSVKKGNSMWHFKVNWTDAGGERREVNYALPARYVVQDLEEPLKYKPRKAAKYVVKAVNEWASGQRGVKIKAEINSRDGVDISGTGKDGDKVQAAMDAARAVRDDAMERYLAQNGYTYLDDGIIPDHSLHVSEYADDLGPLVEALGGPTTDPRVFAELALSFVQSIPYEQRARVSDRYRRPLSILGRNIGDCDSKTVLYLAMMRQAYPDMPLAMVYIKGHAYGALGVEAERGDRSFKSDGQEWVGVEPVGPAVVSVGELGKYSRRKSRFGRRTVRAVS